MSETPASKVRTRFAPSPSGHLHVGGARTALFCWAYVRGRGGHFILRIEDTDQKRSSEAATQAFMEDLQWLGIDWDEGPRYEGCGGGETGPYLQSQRLRHYRRYAEQLITDGLAYRAFETPQELATARAEASATGGAYRYDRSALSLDEATIRRYLAEDRPFVVRLKVPDTGEITVTDAVRGAVSVPAEKLDDFVILKADGYPTYHFAVVVDDELMNVTHVIRGEEHLYNTARHVLLQDALKFRRPVYAHVSLIFNPDGSKMSKREKDKVLRRAVTERSLERPPDANDGSGQPVMPLEHWQWWLSDPDHQLDLDSAVGLSTVLDVELPEIDIEDFRRAGYLPQVMVNYLALLGWSPGTNVEKFDARFLVEHFDLDRVIKSPARFDRDKLLAFNLDALQELTAERFALHLATHGRRYHPDYMKALGGERFELFAAANHTRSKTLEDPFRSCRFFIQADDEIVYEQSKAVRKALEGGDPSGYAHLGALSGILKHHSDWTVGGLEAVISGYADKHAGGKLGKVAQPLRIAVTGGTVSPAIFETLAILGQDPVVNRIDCCLALRKESNLKSQM
ncbi:MAG: glutamate--tRNA ligase [Planctomycetota bacterium]|jgi:glutamyl-tRNA synthetase